MIVRLITPTCRFKVKVNDKDTLHSLIAQKTGQDEFQASLDSTKESLLDTQKTFEELNIQNGTFIHVFYNETKREEKREREKVIKRNITQFCDHSNNAMCSNCAPLDPWDRRYLAENKIKYISYESYIEMLKRENIILEPLNYGKNDCKHHSKNEVCVKCSTQSIGLTGQIYRMIDHVEYDNQMIMQNFMALSKTSNKQLFGILIGTEHEYDHVPLGRKVKVSWIYKPKQENYPDGFVICENELDKILQLHYESNIEKDINSLENSSESEHQENNSKNNNNLQKNTDIFNSKSQKLSNNNDYRDKDGNYNENDDIIELSHKKKTSDSNAFQSSSPKPMSENRPNISSVEALRFILKKLGLKVIGIIYTDLSKQRNYTVSGLETQFIAKMQLKTPYHCPETKTSNNSKLITIICHKQENKEYTTTAFQVSEQCTELFHQKITSPTQDPTTISIDDDSVEIFYKRKHKQDNYDEKISKATEIPPEFFLVSLTHGHKENSVFKSTKNFERDCNLKKTAKYFDNNYTLENFSNLDFLVHSKRKDLFGDKINILLESVIRNDTQKFEEFINSPEFKRFKKTLDPYNLKDWACQACTYVNSGQYKECEMCETPYFE